MRHYELGGDSDMISVVERPPLVLKLSWSPCTLPTERDLHGPTLIDNIGIVLSFVKSSFVDSDGAWTERNTENLRHDVQVTEAPRDWSEKAPGPVEPRVLVKTLSPTFGWPLRHFLDLTELVKTVRDALRGHRNIYFKRGVLHRNINPDSILICPTDFKSSELDRALLSGCLPEQADLGESLRANEDAVQGHHNLYFGRGVLHRDIGAGNTPICPPISSSTMGCIIDLDQAIQSSKRIVYRRFDHPSDFEKTVVQYTNTDCNDPQTLQRIWCRCQGSTGNAMRLAASLRTVKENGDPWHALDAMCYPSMEEYNQWLEKPETCPPSWRDVATTSQQRTCLHQGTVAFMSYEVHTSFSMPFSTASDPYLPALPRSDTLGLPIKITHSVIHDIESFFWIVLYQCMVRHGPGNHRRPEMLYDSSAMQLASRSDAKEHPEFTLTNETEIAILRDWIRLLFDSNDALKKVDLFNESPEYFAANILPLFHPYLERLKPLLFEWWILLQCTYRTYDDVAQGLVLNKVIAMLDKHLDLLAAGAPSEAETSKEAKRLQEKELARREEELATLTAPLTQQPEGSPQSVADDSTILRWSD
ncbi:hypothetical protein EUX98_g8882 [Antrodiella citrinella]|uniref:Fungal-type protein kinase domain-containing protein n=1 Tax=Antrodiella citrinella TaxID=2447956 RepID=A0A4S4M3B7_9APHY|nr:hypothetical protein EUX98_g8882 [Antrodiella citrinella]